MRTWEYEMWDESYKKKQAPDNIKEINEMLRQMYGNEIMIYIDYYKEVIPKDVNGYSEGYSEEDDENEED